MRCFRSFFVFLLGVIVGIVSVAGTALGAAYYISQAPVREVYKWINNGGSFQLAGNVLDLSMFDYGMNIYNKFLNLDTSTIGEIELCLGVDILSDTMEQYLGIPKSKIKPYTVPKVADAVTENLTLGIITTKFGIAMPDLPAFKNQEFLNKPIKTAFGSLDSFKLKDFVVIVTEDDAIKDPTLVPSPKILQKFADLSLSEMSTGMGTVLNTLKLNDIIDVVTDEEATPENPASPKILQTLATLSLGEMSTGMGEVLNKIKLGDIVEVVTDEEATPEKPASPKILQTLATMSLGEMSTGLGEKLNTIKLKDLINLDTAESPILKVLGDSTIGSLPTDIDNLMVKDVFLINDSSNPILKKLTTRPTGSTALDGVYGDKEVFIKDLGSSLDEVTKTLKIGDIVTIDNNSPLVLKSLKDTTLADLNATMSSLTLDKMIPIVTDEAAALDPNLTASSKLLQYIASATTETLDEYLTRATLGDFIKVTADSPALLKALASTSINDFDAKIKVLKISDIITIEESSSPVLKAIANLTLTEMGGDGLTKALDGLQISQLITIDKNSSAILIAIGSLTLAQMGGDGLTNVISGLKISDFVTFSGASSPILDVLKDLTLVEMGDGTLTNKLNALTLGALIGSGAGSSPILDVMKHYTLAEMSDGTLANALNGLTISQMLPSGTPASPLLTAIGGLTLADMSSDKLDAAVNGLLLGDLVEVNEDSSPMLMALANTKIKDLDGKIGTLMLRDVYSAPEGALSLVSRDTLITDLPIALATAFSTKTLGEMAAAGVLIIPEDAPAAIRDMTLSEFVSSYVELLSIVSALPAI